MQTFRVGGAVRDALLGLPVNDTDWVVVGATPEEMIGSGYHLAYIEEDGRAAAAVGYRFLHFLLHGKHIYIDDLTTLPPARKKGYGRALLEHVFAIAAAQGLKFVTLDSGPQRHDAHRLYLNTGFKISSLHFVKGPD